MLLMLLSPASASRCEAEKKAFSIFNFLDVNV